MLTQVGPKLVKTFFPHFSLQERDNSIPKNATRIFWTRNIPQCYVGNVQKGQKRYVFQMATKSLFFKLESPTFFYSTQNFPRNSKKWVSLKARHSLVQNALRGFKISNAQKMLIFRARELNFFLIPLKIFPEIQKNGSHGDSTTLNTDTTPKLFL